MVFLELSENPIGEPATIPPPSSSTISSTIKHFLHHSPHPLLYLLHRQFPHPFSHYTAPPPHQHHHTKQHHRATKISITTLTAIISPKQPHQKKTNSYTYATSTVSTTTTPQPPRPSTYPRLPSCPRNLFQKDKTIRPDHHPKEKPTYTQSVHFH